jgi:hypothetical protein
MDLNQEYFDKQFSEIKSFLQRNMATKDDIAALREEMPSKELINRLYGVADALAQEVKGYREEQAATSHRQDKAENWIKQAEPITGVQFEQ